MFLAAPKMVSFLQLAAEKKTLFLVRLKQIFGPPYFVRALRPHLNASLFRHVSADS